MTDNMTSLRVILLLHIIVSVVYGHLHELDGSFLQLRRNGAWLVKFYAPWCGHCRKMEPAYKEAASQLQTSEIRVGRIDATHFIDVAAHYEVRGYPTIKYINGDRQFTHYGDRSTEGIVKFARRAHRPAVTPLASVGAYLDALDDNGDDAIFLYIGDKDDALHNAFGRVAEDYHVRSSFYTGPVRILPNKVASSLQLSNSKPSVIVVKDGTQYLFQVPADDKRPLNESLRAWVDAERFLAFPHVTESSIWDFASTGKRVALFVVNKTSELSEVERRFKQVGQELSMKHRKEFHDKYHFGWMDDISTASSMTMLMRLPTPNLIVLQPFSDTYYLREDYHQPIEHVSSEAVIKFLRDVADEKVPSYGGKSIWARVKRLGFDLFTGLLDFVATSPLLALFVLGIPLGVVSLLVYLICCLEPASGGDDFDEEDEDDLRHYGNVISAHRLSEGPDGPDYLGASGENQESDKKND